MKLQTEVLIVGAGPAGSVAAIAAQRLGLKSIIIERELMPRDKICGDGILLKDVVSILNKLNVDLSNFINQENLYKPLYFLLTDAGNNKLEVPIETIIVKRQLFDKYLWDFIEEKQEDNLKYDQVHVKNILKQDDGYEVLCSIDNIECIIHTNYIVGADGYSSYIRRNLFNDLKFNCRVASRFYMQVDSTKEIQTAMYFEKDISPGYFWCFKINSNTYNTGVYLAENTEANPYKLHSYYLKKYFGEDLPKDEFKTWPIPYNVRFDNLVKDNTLLVGDAAGLCDKMFGHGIDNAIISGYLSVLSIKDSLNENIHYPIEEIYEYNLNNYLGDTLRKSVSAYDVLDNHPEELLNIMNNMFKIIF